MPPSHLEFLRGLPTFCEVGGYFFVHAGARPGVPLGAQKEEDLLWIREGFVDRDAPFEKLVVHGHTAVDQPYFGTYRINLDTGAYFTDRLSCLVVEGAERRLLGQVNDSSGA
jgi:serine/threonine protein phosphatase 1